MRLARAGGLRLAQAWGKGAGSSPKSTGLAIERDGSPRSPADSVPRAGHPGGERRTRGRRTAAAFDAVAAIVDEVPQAVAGLGTVTRPADIARALKAGAKFLVSPGTPDHLAKAMAAVPVPAVPGCATASEALLLAEYGFRCLKFFPAEASGGAAWLEAMAAPLPDLRFYPTGGIDIGNAARYLALSNVVAVGGSWVAPREAVAAGDFAAIAALAHKAASLRR